MKNILVTGATGMLGAVIVSRLQNKYSVFTSASQKCREFKINNFRQFDLLNKNYRDLINWSKPDVIIHCAAMTNVDECETHSDEAMQINAESVRKLIHCAPYARLIYISTDAVFPRYTHLAKENYVIRGENVYGISKALGEKHVLNEPKNHCIIRTTIVGTNLNHRRTSFAEWIINSVGKKTTVNLFKDVLFTPISIWKLSEYIEWIIEHQVPTILHVAGGEIASKYEFGYNLCRALGLNVKFIRPVKLFQVNLSAQRKLDQTLSSQLFEKISGNRMPSLKDTISDFVKRIKNENN